MAMDSTSRVIARLVVAGLLALGGASSVTMADHAGLAEIAARDLVAAAEREDWAGVKLYAGRIHDPLLAAYATWLDFQQNKSDGSFADITAFMNRHPTWPRQRELQRRAEQALDTTEPHAVLLDWFDCQPPVTGDGALSHLNAISGAGDPARIPALANSYWIEQNFDAEAERKFLRGYERLLTPASHSARLDRLIWQRSHTAANRMIKRVEADEAARAHSPSKAPRRGGRSHRPRASETS